MAAIYSASIRARSKRYLILTRAITMFPRSHWNHDDLNNFNFESNTMKFEAVVRTELGKGASRRLRHAGKFPAVVYGGEAAAVSIVLNHDDIVNQMDKPEFYEGIVLVIDGAEVKVKPQDVQRHAYKPKVEHMDFIRI